jgi:Fe(3+) dicitrate transport protein
MRVVAGNVNIDEINGIKVGTVVDISVNYQIDDKQSLYVVMVRQGIRSYMSSRWLINW